MPSPTRTVAVFIAGIALSQLALPANAQTAPLSLAQERAAAKAAGIELSSKVLSAAMPPTNENAALFYSKYEEIERTLGASETQYNDDFKALEAERTRPTKLTNAEWASVRRALERRSGQIKLLRHAATRPYCVFCANEYVPRLTREDALADPYLPAAGQMRGSARLIIEEAFWDAHSGNPHEAIRDISCVFQFARQFGSHETISGYLTANAIDSLAVSGLRTLLRMSGKSADLCRAVQAAISDGWRPRNLSGALIIQNAYVQDTVDAFMSDSPELPDQEFTPQRVARYYLDLDVYGAYELRQIRRCIEIADAPYTQSEPILRAIGEESDLKYPENGELTNFVGDFSGAAFQRDFVVNSVHETEAGAAVLIYRDEHGKFPAALADAMPNAPTDAFDGKPLHYEVTPTGFVISATHQRPGHAPEPVTFRYSQSASSVTK